MTRPKPAPAKRAAGRPSMHGERMTNRTLALPPDVWAELDDEAHEARISTAELIRQRLGVGARRRAQGESKP